MDPTVTVAVITATGVVLAAVITLAGVRFTQRQARAAAEATAALDRAKVDAAAYESARTTWDEHVDSLRQQVADLREESERLRVLARDLRGRVDDLEASGRADRARMRELVEYAKGLLRILAEHEISYPQPPPDLL